jgi:hypothetical protein
MFTVMSLSIHMIVDVTPCREIAEVDSEQELLDLHCNTSGKKSGNNKNA